MNNNSLSNSLGLIILFILLIIIFACVFSINFKCGCKKEPFDGSTCTQDPNLNDPNFLNQRFFNYDNINKLVPSDPVHVPRSVVDTALLSGTDMIENFDCAKKKTQ